MMENTLFFLLLLCPFSLTLVISTGESQPDDIHAVIQEMKATLVEQSMKIEKLQTLSQVGQVAFSAALLTSGDRFVGPYRAHTTLVFKYVVTNIGNAYNPNTGFFIAPVKGAYHFELYNGVWGDIAYGSGTSLVKNGQQFFSAVEHQMNGFGSAANGVTLILEAEDIVFVRLWENTRVWDNLNHHCTFSGHLLFAL